METLVELTGEFLESASSITKWLVKRKTLKEKYAVWVSGLFFIIPYPYQLAFHTNKRGRGEMVSQIPATSFFIFSFMCLRPIHACS